MSPFQEIRRRCDSWLRHYDRFWTFLHVPLELTNNRTEREIRPLVVRRKICSGTRSDAGEKWQYKYSLSPWHLLEEYHGFQAVGFDDLLFRRANWIEACEHLGVETQRQYDQAKR